MVCKYGLVSPLNPRTASDLHKAWLMQFNDGWWAYFDDECPIGPFDTTAEASRAGLQACPGKSNRNMLCRSR